MIISTSILLVPGQKYDTLTTSDSGWVYDVAVEISKNEGFVKSNPLSHAPYGWTVVSNEQLQPLLTVILYKGVSSLNSSVSLMDVVMFWAPLIFAISLIPIFLIGKELGGDFGGAAAAFFAAFMVSSIYWMKVGAYDREPIKFILTSLTLYFTIKLFKAPKGEMPKFAILAGISFGLFILAWPGAIFLTAIVFGGLIFVLLTGFFGKLIRNFSDIFGSVSSTIRNHLDLIIWVLAMMGVVSLISLIFGQPPGSWAAIFQTMVDYAGIGGGGAVGVSMPVYATEAQVAGPIDQTLRVFYNDEVLSAFVVLLMGVSLARFLWTRKRWEIFVFAWMIVLVAMVFPGTGQSRYVREWWPLVAVLAGVGVATLVSLVRRALSHQSLGWLRGIQNPMLATVVIIVAALPFVMNAYAVADVTTPPTEWGGRTGLDSDLMDSFRWLKENTSEDSIVAIEWSFGHLLTGASGRPTVADGVESVGEEGKWENVSGPAPPDYIYVASDSTGTFLDEHFVINGRRNDVQRLPSLGSDEEILFYIDTYRENYDVRIDYWLTHAYQAPEGIFGTIREISSPSLSTSLDDRDIVFAFSGENVFYNHERMEAFKVQDNVNQYFTGIVLASYSQSGGIGNPFDHSFRVDSQVSKILWIFIPDWIESPTFDQTVALQSAPYYDGPPLYSRIFEGVGELPDFMSVAYTSPNGLVKVIKIDHGS